MPIKRILQKITSFLTIDQTSAIIKKFLYALTWNSINIFIYKIILLLHQIVLFYFIPHELYGISGTLFAALYLIIGCTGLGFEYSLFSLFAPCSQNRSMLKSLYYQSLAKTLITITIAVGIYTYIATHPTLMPNLTPNILLYLIIIFIAESLRKYLETIAQLAFLNKQIAYIQITMIAAYVLLVWSAYATIGTITLQTIFIPMIVVSLGEILWILQILHNWRKTIPEESPPWNKTSTKNSFLTITEYSCNYINQLSKNLFSPNFLMLVIASTIGMEKTGIVRYFTNIITLLYMLLGRGIGIPSGAIFSAVKNGTTAEKKSAFLSITNTYIQLLYILAIVVSTSIIPIIIRQTDRSTTNIVSSFILAGFIEYITITYEKLYLVERASLQLACINGISAIAYLLYLWITPINNSLFLLPVCSIRIITVCAIGFYASIKWSIVPRLTPQIKSLLTGALFALCTHAIFSITWI